MLITRHSTWRTKLLCGKQTVGKGINPGSSLGAVDIISLSSETDDEGDSGEDSDSSHDGMQVISNDLLRQRQVSPPTSPLQNKFLAGFMKSPDKPQTDAQVKQALDEDPFSLTPSFKQAEDSSLNRKQGQKTGNVTGHGGSVPAQRGYQKWISSLFISIRSSNWK
jgi:hypothetical protein